MPDHRDPLASSTLAQLYLSQGHFEQARRLLVQVLVDDPYDGVGLVLRERLDARGRESLVGERDGRTVLARYRVRAEYLVGSGVHVVHLTYLLRTGPSGAATRARVSSTRCTSTSGLVRLEPPAGAGSMSLALARLDPDRRLRILAVAEVVSWST